MVIALAVSIEITYIIEILFVSEETDGIFLFVGNVKNLGICIGCINWAPGGSIAYRRRILGGL